MRRFKGLYIPRADPGRVNCEKRGIGEAPMNLRRAFCYRSRLDDCEDAGKERRACDGCLFYCYSIEGQKGAFDEWYKNKGKVEYDKETSNGT